MQFLHPLVVLLVFFGILFYFKEPLRNIPAQFNTLHSPYASSFKQKFNELIHASSTTLFGTGQNYIPSTAGSTSTNSTSNVNTNSSLPANSAKGTSINSNSTTSSVIGMPDTKPWQQKTDLLPVLSDQQQVTALSVSGIISYTNKERTKLGISYLGLDSKLTHAAESKLQDMFQNQYFEHVSPTGESVSDVAKKAGYEYIVVGENLALGIFGGDDQVVAAWMASPGHKKNILDERYRDIGIAVGQGMYQGRKQWLIVQHFGKPLSSCSLPNEVLKKKIETEKKELGFLEAKITTVKAEVETLTGDAYTTKATEYNSLVADYNIQLTTLRKDIDDYNISARVFNTCAGIAN
jgi:uncharacterized protein YkwD